MLQSAAWLKEKVTRKYYKETSLEIAIWTQSILPSLFSKHMFCSVHPINLILHLSLFANFFVYFLPSSTLIIFFPFP